MCNALRLLMILVAVCAVGGCSLVVDFDRSLLVDGGPDGGIDAGQGGAGGQGGIGASAGGGGAGGRGVAGAGGAPAN